MENVTGRRNFVTECKNLGLLENTVNLDSVTFANTRKINFLTYKVIHGSAVLAFKDYNNIPLCILNKSFPSSLEMFILFRFSSTCN